MELKKISYSIVLVVLIYGVIELLSYGSLFYLSNFRHTRYEPVDQVSSKHREIIQDFIKKETNYINFNSTLGWSIKPNGLSRLYQANSAAIRSDREYSTKPPPGTRRISSYGDSFTHGDEVNNSETWQAVLEEYDSKTEVLNFGVGGYGLDQSYLRYLEDGRQYHPHVVLIGYMSENIMRNVNVYRPFYYAKTGLPLAKPRFIIRGESFMLLQNPLNSLNDYKMLLLQPQRMLSEMGTNDYFYKQKYTSSPFDWSPTLRIATLVKHKFFPKPPEDEIMKNEQYNHYSQAFKVTRRIFDQFYITAINNGSTPIIIIFPNKGDLKRDRRTKNRVKRYAPLLAYFDSTGYKYLDLIEAFGNVETKDLFTAHYSPLANRLVAKYILTHINDMVNK